MPRLLDVQVPTVESQASPVSREEIHTDPSMFGGAFGEAEQKLGKDTTEAATQQLDIYNETAANSLYNNFVDRVQKYQWGDPSDPTSKGIMTLNGQDAMQAGHSATQDVEQIRQQVLAGAPNGRAALMADMAMRRQMAYAMERINDRVSRQADAWRTSTALDSAKVAVTAAALSPEDDNQLQHSLADAERGHISAAKATSPDQIAVATRTADTEVVHATFNQLIAQNKTAQAIALLDKYGAKMDPIVRDQLQPVYDRAKSQSFVTTGKGVYDSAHAANPQWNQIEQKYGLPQGLLWHFHRIEGNGVSSTGATGPFAFTGGTARQYGLKNRWDPIESGDATARYAVDNRDRMRSALGRDPTASELYLAHQQDASGAIKLLAHPNERAGDLVGDHAIIVNGGNPNAPASQFISRFEAKFNAPGAPSTTPFGGRPLEMTRGTQGGSFGGPMPTLSFDEAEPQSFKEFMFDRIDQAEKNKQLTFNQAMESRRYASEMQASENAANSGERQALEKEIPNYMAAAEAGVEGAPELPMDRVNALLPSARARQVGEQYVAAKHAGMVMKQIEWDTPQETAEAQRDLFSGQGRLSDTIRTSVHGGTTGPGTVGAEGGADTVESFKLRERLANRLTQLLQQRQKNLDDDPAAYSLRNPRVKQAADSGDIDAYAKEQLGMQTHLGVPPGMQHILPKNIAGNLADKLTNATDTSTELLRMQQEYKGQWDNVYRDMVWAGLSPSFQAIATLEDPKMAADLGRWLREIPKDKEAKDLVGEKFVTEARDSVLKGTQDLQNSLMASGMPAQQIHGITTAVEQLAFAEKYYRRDDNAIQTAIQAFNGKWEFQGNVRIPVKQFDATMHNAGQNLRGLTLADVEIPKDFEARYHARPQEWLENLKAKPDWITNKQANGLWLKDYAGEVLHKKDGTPWEIPFADQGQRELSQTPSPIVGTP